MKMFARMTKVDEAQRTVSGRAVQEITDRAGEIFDYARSKPNFEKWSNTISKATEGKSVGNVRAMHGKVAAGKLTEIIFQDDECAIDITAKIVDDNEWKKCVEGVYTGFSIGGSYVEKWADKENPTMKRYEADPAEISIVDFPCVPTSTFSYVKADGSAEMRKFVQPEDAAEKAAVNELAELLNAGTVKAADVLALVKVKVVTDTADLVKAKADELRAELDKPGLTNLNHEQLAEKFLPPDQRDGNPLELLARLEKIATPKAAREETDPKESENGIVKFADPVNKKYPIETAAHVRAAWSFINKSKNSGKYGADDVKVIKANIVAAWKRLIDTSGPAGAEKFFTDSGVDQALAKRWVSVPGTDGGCGIYFPEGLSAVASFAGLVEMLWQRAAECRLEQEYEGDTASTLPDLLDALAAQAGEILVQMAQEETAEAAGVDDAQKVAVADALTKRFVREVKTPLFDLLLAKYGARHSKTDAERLQKAHDCISELGANCKGSDAEKLAKAADLSKAVCTTLGLAEDVTLEVMTKAVQKAVEKAKKWDAAPAPTTVVLRAIDKAQDTDPAAGNVPADTEKLIKDAEGGDALSAMKLIHRFGGRPAAA